MSKQVSRVCFLMLLLISMTQFCYSASKENKTIAQSPKYDEPASPSPEYSKISTPDVVEEPDFFSPEQYPQSSIPPSPSPVSETQKLIADDKNASQAQLNRTSPPSANSSFPELKTVSPAPEASQFSTESETTQIAPSEMASDYEVEVSPAPTSSILPSDAEESNSQEIESSTSENNAEAPVSSLVEATEDENKETEDNPVVEPPVSSSSDVLEDQNSEDNSTAENMESLTSEDNSSTEAETEDKNIEDNSTPENMESLTSDDSSIVEESVSSEENTEDVGISPVSENSVLPSTYTAEDDAGDIVYEEKKYGDGNGVKVAGFMAGVGLIALVGLACNSQKKKKTQFQYESLSKGI